MSARLCVVGAGRSGAVTAACLADLGQTVVAVDVDAARVDTLSRGRAPFHEPGLDDLIARNLQAGRLSFTTEYADAIPGAGCIMLSVDTPPQRDGDADLSSFYAATRMMAPLLEDGAVVVTRSTVPIGTNAALREAIRAENGRVRFNVVSNPEFLREGNAVEDFKKPERIVIGADTDEGGRVVAALYESLDRPIVLCDLETAEVIKYAANAYLALGVSFINEIANICDRVGADVAEVTRALRLDSRIGPRAYLDPGLGFGGSCLPKDLRALAHTAERHGYDAMLLRAVRAVNDAQPDRVLAPLRSFFDDLAGRRIAVLGLSFKGDTYDLRSSPALTLIRTLASEGALVRTFDPVDDGSAEAALAGHAELAQDPYSAAAGCDAVIVATDHSSFRTLDLERLHGSMRAPVFVDGRNLFDPDMVSSAGFTYLGVGRRGRAD